MSLKSVFCFLSCNLLFLLSVSVGQEDFVHPELEWQTIETQHFLVHFQNGAERTGREVAKIAESIYGPITKMYEHEPDSRVSFIIRDHDDYSNGASYFYENRIVIYAPSLDFELRGVHPWLWNVVTHEFTHMVQIQTTMKFGRTIPGIYFQWLGYESERRPDVLYGYPNILVSYPISGFVLPMWFAEGVAQYNNPDLDYDYWDTHRDMILRMNMTGGKMMSWEEMSVFGKNSLGNESTYNAGFSLVQYIAEKYGCDKLREISTGLSSVKSITINGAIEAALGKTGDELYNEWREEKSRAYKKTVDSINSEKIDGKIIENEGFGNYYPVFSPDGSKIAYVSNKGEDYLSLSSIYVYDVGKREAKEVVSTVRSTISFSPDGRYIYYSKITRRNPFWSGFNDLFRYDLLTEHEEQLTKGRRAFNPKLSPDGRRLVYIVSKDGTLNIGICDSDGTNAKLLTDFAEGEQVYTPVFSPDGKTIAFGYTTGQNQSIALMDTGGCNFRVIRHTGDCRDPFFSDDSTMFYSWDNGGIFNLYSLDLNSGLEKKITNVPGGAFLPSLSSDKDIVFVLYTTTGYKISLMKYDSAGGLQNSEEVINIDRFNSTERHKVVSEEEVRFQRMAVKDDISKTDTIKYFSKPYRSVFTSISLIPMLRIDNYNEHSKGIDVIKPGLYFMSSEVLEKMDIFGGAAVNRKLERDLFLMFNYRDKIPLLYQLGLDPVASLELYSISRKQDVSFDLYVDVGGPYGLRNFSTDVTYSLFELDLSLKQYIFSESLELKLLYTLSKYDQNFGSWTHVSRNGWVVIPATRSTYFIGNSLSLQLKYDGIHRTVDREINPVGRSVSLKCFYEMDKFNPKDTAEYKNGFRVPLYTKYYFPRIELRWNENIPLALKNNTFSFSVTATGIIGDSIDQFFNYYTGGFLGMKGYSFYAIGGNKTISIDLSYRFPISTELNFRLLQMYFKKLFGSVFFDAGDGFYKKIYPFRKWKKDVGFELRLEAFSFYAYPTRIMFSGAYGLDKFSRTTQDINYKYVTYGNEWRFYLGILFGFELNDIAKFNFMR